jgi:hypothetical protein
MQDLFDCTITPDTLGNLLANQSININEVRLGSTPIQYYADNGKWNLVNVMAQKRETDEKDNARYGSALLDAVYNNKLDVAKNLIKAGANFLWKRHLTGNTVLHAIVQNGDLELLQLALDHHIFPKPLNNKNQSPILLAAEEKKWRYIHPILTEITQLYSGGPNSSNSQLTSIDLFHYKSIINIITNEANSTPYTVGIVKNLEFLAKKDYYNQFIKIYNALYEAQSSLFKSKYPWGKITFVEIAQLIKYAKEHPGSRTAQAIVLTDKFLETKDQKALVRAIHSYGKGKSSSLGIFKWSRNEKGLSKDAFFDDTYNNADENSRTGKIRNSL